MKVPFFKHILIIGVIVYATAALAIPELDVDTQDLQERSEAMKEADIENPIGIDHKLKPRANVGGGEQSITVPIAELQTGALPADIAGLGPQVLGGGVQDLGLAGFGGAAGGAAGGAVGARAAGGAGGALGAGGAGGARGAGARGAGARGAGNRGAGNRGAGNRGAGNRGAGARGAGRGKNNNNNNGRRRPGRRPN